MNRHGKKLSVMVLLFVALCITMLASCSASEKGVKAAKKATEATVTTQVGSVESYTGVVNPTLEANYHQTPEEAQRYGAQMEEILTNGSDADRVLQSGI